jgi:hypothetical protein
MNGTSDTQKVVKNLTVAFNTELVKPVFPMDFIKNMLCCSGGDCLTRALENNRPAQRLLNYIILGYMCQIDAAAHDGKIERMLQEMLAEIVPDALRAMGELGWEW